MAITNSTADRHIEYTECLFVCGFCECRNKKKTSVAQFMCVHVSKAQLLAKVVGVLFCLQKASIESIVNIHLFDAIFGIGFPYFCMSSSYIHTDKFTEQINKAETVGFSALSNRYPDIILNGIRQIAAKFNFQAVFQPNRDLICTPELKRGTMDRSKPKCFRVAWTTFTSMHQQYL